jgi:hypothetical protein
MALMYGFLSAYDHLDPVHPTADRIVPPTQNFMRIHKYVTPLILYQVTSTSRLVTILKFSYAPIQVSDVLSLEQLTLLYDSYVKKKYYKWHSRAYIPYLML